MKYKLLSARRMLVQNTYEVVVQPLPETFIERFQLSSQQKYHVRSNEWYKMPGFQRCPQDLESRLTTLYSHVQQVAEQEPTPNSNTL